MLARMVEGPQPPATDLPDKTIVTCDILTSKPVPVSSNYFTAGGDAKYCDERVSMCSLAYLKDHSP